MLVPSAGCDDKTSVTERGGSILLSVRCGLNGLASAGKPARRVTTSTFSATATSSPEPSLTPSQMIRARLARGKAPMPSKRTVNFFPRRVLLKPEIRASRVAAAVSPRNRRVKCQLGAGTTRPGSGPSLALICSRAASVSGIAMNNLSTFSEPLIPPAPLLQPVHLDTRILSTVADPWRCTTCATVQGFPGVSRDGIENRKLRPQYASSITYSPSSPSDR